MRRFILVLAAACALLTAACGVAQADAAFTSPDEGATVSGTVTVDATATDPSGINRCVLQTDTARIGVDYTAPYEWSWDTTTYANGPQTLKLNCYAGDGTVALPRVTLDTTVDNTAPPAAAFTATQDTATRTLLDATSSTGEGALSYAWTLDGQALAATDAQTSIVPTEGDHTIGLTVTDDQGHTSTTSQTVNVIWRGWPYTAQVLPYAQIPGAQDNVGPWRRLDAATADDYLPQPDGSVNLLVHDGDHPSISGGDRIGLGLNEAYDWSLAGAAGPLDLQGNTDSTVKFYRDEFMLPSSNTFPLVGYNNFSEWRGGSWTTLKIAPNGAGDSVQVVFTPKYRGVAQPRVVLDLHAITPDQWENYVLEVKLSADPTVGYVRVYRNGMCVSCGTPSADAEGRIFGATKKSDADGTEWPTTLEQQLYREPGITTVGYMDVRDTEIGTTLASVTGP